MEFVLINERVYPTNTQEEMTQAKAAMRDAEIKELPVWVSPTDEYSPDVRKTGQILFA